MIMYFAGQGYLQDKEPEFFGKKIGEHNRLVSLAYERHAMKTLKQKRRLERRKKNEGR